MRPIVAFELCKLPTNQYFVIVISTYLVLEVWMKECRSCQWSLCLFSCSSFRSNEKTSIRKQTTQSIPKRDDRLFCSDTSFPNIYSRNFWQKCDRDRSQSCSFPAFLDTKNVWSSCWTHHFWTRMLAASIRWTLTSRSSTNRCFPTWHEE